MKSLLPGAVAASLALCLSSPAHAWLTEGHSTIAAAAVRSLPAEVPIWFREGSGQIAHDAQDPDIQKSKDLTFMNDAEGPQHYIDSELLQGRPLPTSRKEFYALCAELKLDPSNVGELPYALAEWTQRLTMTFAEARMYPDNPYIRTKSLIYAGILTHYAGDVCMPLHVTLDHDGRAKADGSSPRSGIHLRTDALIERLKLSPDTLAKGQQPRAFAELFPAIEAQIKDSQSKIDLVYQLEAQLPPKDEKDTWTATPAVQSLTNERARAATNFAASLLLTAWRDSAKIKMPEWYKRLDGPQQR
jgi:hypothetical protein